ncbi:hypothetical protein D623_10018835 [Myotis brandtii]|uniref:Uncharacterized protein n=1 Tax=Myotis brandtii TaxID=109478 RepID=S7MI71_MYOBR|nr:hypothetical protein D623_10018835 [Myotis brandtii]
MEQKAGSQAQPENLAELRKGRLDGDMLGFHVRRSFDQMDTLHAGRGPGVCATEATERPRGSVDRRPLCHGEAQGVCASEVDAMERSRGSAENFRTQEGTTGW